MYTCDGSDDEGAAAEDFGPPAIENKNVDDMDEKAQWLYYDQMVDPEKERTFLDELNTNEDTVELVGIRCQLKKTSTRLLTFYLLIISNLLNIFNLLNISTQIVSNELDRAVLKSAFFNKDKELKKKTTRLLKEFFKKTTVSVGIMSNKMVLAVVELSFRYIYGATVPQGSRDRERNIAKIESLTAQENTAVRSNCRYNCFRFALAKNKGLAYPTNGMLPATYIEELDESSEEFIMWNSRPALVLNDETVEELKQFTTVFKANKGKHDDGSEIPSLFPPTDREGEFPSICKWMKHYWNHYNGKNVHTTYDKFIDLKCSIIVL
jgi:hypothetical protein